MDRGLALVRLMQDIAVEQARATAYDECHEIPRSSWDAITEGHSMELMRGSMREEEEDDMDFHAALTGVRERMR